MIARRLRYAKTCRPLNSRSNPEWLLPYYPAQAGVRGSDAPLLARQGAHLAVSTARISVQR
jgi:hypothetical protein